MWPLTLVPPKYKESFIVSFADKYFASKEFVNKFKQSKIQNRANRQPATHKTRKKRMGRPISHHRK